MANTVKKLNRGALPTSLGTLYTTPSATTAVVTNIVLTNTTAASVAGTIKLGGQEVLSAASVAANGLLALDLKQVLEAGDLIEGLASASGLKVHISGMEIA